MERRREIGMEGRRDEEKEGWREGRKRAEGEGEEVWAILRGGTSIIVVMAMRTPLKNLAGDIGPLHHPSCILGTAEGAAVWPRSPEKLWNPPGARMVGCVEPWSLSRHPIADLPPGPGRDTWAQPRVMVATVTKRRKCGNSSAQPQRARRIGLGVPLGSPALFPPDTDPLHRGCGGTCGHTENSAHIPSPGSGSAPRTHPSLSEADAEERYRSGLGLGQVTSLSFAFPGCKMK